VLNIVEIWEPKSPGSLWATPGLGNRISRFDVILSHMMKRNIITLASEIVDPIDEIMFDVV
jgi:hypothetical protein